MAKNKGTRENKTRDLPTNVRERDGKYTYRYRVPATYIDADGVERKKGKEMESPRFDTIKEAEEYGILIKARKIQKKLRYESTITVSAWSKVWLKEYELEREPRKHTLDSRENSVRVINEYLGAIALRDVTPYDYQQILFNLKEKGFSRSTITSHHTTAKLMFRSAVKSQIIENNPTAEATVPKEKQKKRKPGEKRQVLPLFLEKDELLHFLQVARFVLSVNNWAVFVVLAYTGLRISELAGLQWHDIDKRRRTIDVNKQIEADNSIFDYVFEPPKNEQSERIVSYGDTVAKALEILENWQKSERLSAKNFNPKDNFVFWCTSYPGYPIIVTNMGKQMRKVLKQANLLTNLTPHSLRHTHVSLLASNPRVSLPEIQARIGHKGQSKVTTLIYLHVTKNRQLEIADDFEWAINN